MCAPQGQRHDRAGGGGAARPGGAARAVRAGDLRAVPQPRARSSRDRLMTLSYEAHQKGLRFVGNSCPGRCSTLLNYYGMTRDLMPYIAEQPTSLKLGMYLPGKHIPVVNNQRLIDEQPDYVVLLAWHYAAADRRAVAGARPEVEIRDAAAGIPRAGRLDAMPVAGHQLAQPPSPDEAARRRLISLLMPVFNEEAQCRRAPTRRCPRCSTSFGTTMSSSSSPTITATTGRSDRLAELAAARPARQGAALQPQLRLPALAADRLSLCQRRRRHPDRLRPAGSAGA